MSPASRSSSDSDDPTYQPYGRPESSVRPSRRLTTGGGGGGGDNQSHQPPYLPSSAKRKRTPLNFHDPSPKPTTSRQQDATHASLTQDDTGKGHHDENATRKEIGSSFVDPSLALIHLSVINKYGDIGRECPFVDPKLRTYILESIYKVVQELQGKTLETLDENSLVTYDLSLRDAEFAKFDVKWLRQRLHELRDEVKTFIETTQAKNEKIKLMEDIDILKENIESLKLIVEEKEKKLALKTSDAERLSSKISCLKPRYEEISLIDGLL